MNPTQRQWCALPVRWQIPVLACLLGFGVAWAAAPAPAPEPPSAAAQRLYQGTRARLVQVRTLLKNQNTQATTGSGFLVSEDGLIITNYHVVSQVALQPQRYRLTYNSADGLEGALELLAVDVIQDLALVRMANAAAAGGRGHLAFRPQTQPLIKGEHIYSLGNPLDVGFALTEGLYNGLVERRLYPSIFFGGALNPGMSGGPTLDEAGLVVGVNVATRRDGQQVSFLVPAGAAQSLLARGRTATALTKPIHAEVGRQLMQHQQVLVDRFLAQSWRWAEHPRYRVPLPAEAFMRCWGSTSAADSKGLDYERSDCRTEVGLFVTDSLYTGTLSLRHEVYDGKRLGVAKFTQQYAAGFRNEGFTTGARTEVTPPQCHESFVAQPSQVPLRVVLCMNAYRKYAGLFDLSVLVATQDQDLAGVQARLDARGVSFGNAMRLAQHYVEGFAWKP